MFIVYGVFVCRVNIFFLGDIFGIFDFIFKWCDFDKRICDDFCLIFISVNLKRLEKFIVVCVRFVLDNRRFCLYCCLRMLSDIL